MSNDSILPRVSFLGWYAALSGTGISEETMRQICRVSRDALSKFLVLILSLAVALPAAAYDYPLSSTAIRDAYFLGTRQGGLTPQFLAAYSHFVSELHQGSCTSEIRLETPFLQVVA